MYNTLKLAAGLALSGILLCGCGVLQSKVDIKNKEYVGGNSEINVEIPEFRGLSDKSFERRLNEEYEKNISAWVEDFLEEKSDDEACVFELKQDIKRKKSPIISVVGEAYVYTGGVHGRKERIAKNIDIENNKELKLEDLFEDSAYLDFLNRKLEELAEENPEKYHDLWEKPIIGDARRSDFYICEDELVVYYPPYELSYYAKGFVEFNIPISEIKSYLKAGYKEL